MLFVTNSVQFVQRMPYQGSSGWAWGLQHRRANYTGKQISKNFVSVMNMLLIYLFASMELEKGHRKLLGSSLKIMLPLLYITK